MTHCKTCHQPITWAYTTKGHRIPLDPKPTPNGNLVIVDGVARVVDLLTPPGQRWTSHFATCPEADQHRRAR